MSEPWQTDNRWRRLKVSSQLLSDFLACGVDGGITTTAPSDLKIIGMNEVLIGPTGYFVFVVWSATFEPLPMDGAGHLLDAIPYIEFTYTRHYKD